MKRINHRGIEDTGDIEPMQIKIFSCSIKLDSRKFVVIRGKIL
jgi:hypothetical protein